eukprot:COSAG06_NODE_6031_length_3145_cov_26.486868_1_plen_143_part_10
MGYHLHCERSSTEERGGGDDAASSDAQAARIASVISGILGSEHPPNQLGDIGTEISFGLNAAAPIERFPELLTALEDRKAELGVSTYGLSATTLEEVFLNLDKANKEKKREEEEKKKKQEEEDKTTDKKKKDKKKKTKQEEEG